MTDNGAARANPFSDLDAPSPSLDLSDFTPKPAGSAKRTVNATALERISAEHGFPSRAPVHAKTVPAAVAANAEQRPRRRYTTGRNQQVNLKATPDTIELLNELADRAGCSLAEVLERALDALNPLVPPKAKPSK